jgi:hypothetical protein
MHGAPCACLAYPAVTKVKPPAGTKAGPGIFRRRQPYSYCCGLMVLSQVAIVDPLERTTASANEQK